VLPSAQMEARLGSRFVLLILFKNLGNLFDKIETAKAPEAFTTRFLADVIGLKFPADRSLINMLKKMGFFHATGRPAETYALRTRVSPRQLSLTVFAKIYASLFEANELSPEELRV
jgi:hypothetical protein